MLWSWQDMAVRSRAWTSLKTQCVPMPHNQHVFSLARPLFAGSWWQQSCVPHQYSKRAVLNRCWKHNAPLARSTSKT